MILRKCSALVILLALLISILAPASLTKAAGGVYWPAIRLSGSSSSAAANGTAITVTASFFLYECNQMSGPSSYYKGDEPSDCDNYGGVKGEVAYTGPCPYNDTIVVNLNVSGQATLSKTSICGGSTGKDTFTVKSTTVGTATITPVISWSYSASTKSRSPITLSFTTPPVAAAPKPKPAPAPTPAPAPVVEKLAAPTVATVTVNDQTVAKDQQVSFATNEPLVLSGKTIPNGKVSLYVFSDPKLFETTADAEGNWSVKVEGLPEGSHHAEVEVTNPTTNQKSDRTKLLDFSVVAATQPLASERSAGPAKSTSLNGGRLALFVVLAAVVVGGIAYLLWKRKQRAKHTNDGDQSGANPPLNPPSDNPTDGAASTTGSSEADPPAQEQ